MKPPSDMTDDKLNAAVAVEVMGWSVPERYPVYIAPCVKRKRGGAWKPWLPATDIAAAMNDVVGEMGRKGFYLSLYTSLDGSGSARFVSHGEAAHRVIGRGRRNDEPRIKPPRAICEAALTAIRSEQ